MHFTKYINWLSTHKTANVILLCVYYLLVVLPHEWVGEMTVQIFGGLTRDHYNLLIAGIAILCLLAYGYIVLRNISRGDDRLQQYFYLAATVCFAVLSIHMLFVINIEVVHFVQYGVFAILCFPLVKNYICTLIWATLAGVLDEAYQYFYLALFRTEYYDFNDVVSNLIGAAFGLILLRSYGVKSKYITVSDFFRTKVFWVIIVLAVTTVGFLLSDHLDLYPSGEGEARYLVVRKIPESFWSVVHPNVTFHIMLPFEGLIITILLWVFYRRIGE